MAGQLAGIGLSMAAALLAACGGGGGSGMANSLPVDAVVPAAGAATPPAKGLEVSEVVTVTREAIRETAGAGEAIEGYVNKPLLKGNVVDVRVGTVTPAVIEGTLYAGSMMPNTALQATAIGDIAPLNGKPLYIKVVDPVGMFASGAAAASGAGSAPTLYLGLQGKVMSVPGSYAGHMPIWACLDAACGTTLRGMPYQMPYRVDVLYGYRTLDGNTPFGSVNLQVRSRLGETPALTQLTVIPPERAPFSTLTASAFNPRGPSAMTPVTSLADRGDGTVTLTIAPPVATTPGSYMSMISLGSYHRVGLQSGPIGMTVYFWNLVD